MYLQIHIRIFLLVSEFVCQIVYIYGCVHVCRRAC